MYIKYMSVVFSTLIIVAVSAEIVLTKNITVMASTSAVISCVPDAVAFVIGTTFISDITFVLMLS